MAKRQLAELQRCRDEARRVLDELDDDTLTELVRRASGSARPDGFPRSTGLGSASGGDVSRPVEATVTAAAGGECAEDGRVEVDTPDSWPDRADPALESIVEVLSALPHALRVLKPAGRKLQHLRSVRDAAAGRQSSLQGDCQACGESVTGVGEDRLRAGYCSRCRKAWERWRDRQVAAGELGADPAADRLRFERWRREQLAERDGLLEVVRSAS